MPTAFGNDLASTLAIGFAAIQLYQTKFPAFWAEHALGTRALTPGILLNLIRSLLINLSVRYFPVRANVEIMGNYETDGTDDPCAPLHDPTSDAMACLMLSEYGADILTPYPIVFGYDFNSEAWAETPGYALSAALWTIAQATEWNAGDQLIVIQAAYPQLQSLFDTLPQLPAATPMEALCNAATIQYFGVSLATILRYAWCQTDNFFAHYDESFLSECYAPFGEISWDDDDSILDSVRAEFQAAEAMYRAYWSLAHNLTEHPTKLIAIATYLVDIATTLIAQELV